MVPCFWKTLDPWTLSRSAHANERVIFAHRVLPRGCIGNLPSLTTQSRAWRLSFFIFFLPISFISFAGVFICPTLRGRGEIALLG